MAISLDLLTVQATWIIGLALIALIAVGWRRPARALPGRDRSRAIEVERLPGEPYRRPNLLRRIAAALGAGALAVVIGAVVAVIVAFGAVLLVIGLTGLLDQ